jgi:CheY-like chemotaxis protein
LEAENGSEAVNKAKQFHPDLILMDIMMSVMGGLEATQLIRGFTELSDVPIFVVTAYGLDCYDKAIEAGYNEMIGKPVDFGSMKPLLKKYLQ